MHLACQSGSLELVKYLVDLKKIDINATDIKKKKNIFIKLENETILCNFINFFNKVLDFTMFMKLLLI